MSEQQEKKSLLVQILDALKATEEKTHITESSENLVDKNKEEANVNGKSENLADNIKEEQVVNESSEDQLEQNKEDENVEEFSDGMIDNNNEAKNDETEKPCVKDDTDIKSEKISEIVAILEKIEQVHREQRDDLLEANKILEDPGVTKVSKMQDKILKVKEPRDTQEPGPEASGSAELRWKHCVAHHNQHGR